MGSVERFGIENGAFVIRARELPSIAQLSHVEEMSKVGTVGIGITPHSGFCVN